jgi:MFS family permease
MWSMAETVAVVSLPTTGATHLGIVAGLAMGPAVGLGLGRFAYALLLPAMRADLGWSYAVAGAMNTANAVGYLVGALAAAPIAARVGDKRCFLAGVLLTALSLLATGFVTDIASLALVRGWAMRRAVADRRSVGSQLRRCGWVAAVGWRTRGSLRDCAVAA